MRAIGTRPVVEWAVVQAPAVRSRPEWQVAVEDRSSMAQQEPAVAVLVPDPVTAEMAAAAAAQATDPVPVPQASKDPGQALPWAAGHDKGPVGLRGWGSCDRAARAWDRVRDKTLSTQVWGAPPVATGAVEGEGEAEEAEAELEAGRPVVVEEWPAGVWVLGKAESTEMLDDLVRFCLIQRLVLECDRASFLEDRVQGLDREALMIGKLTVRLPIIEE